jgi:hypothetical protein
LKCCKCYTCIHDKGETPTLKDIYRTDLKENDIFVSFNDDHQQVSGASLKHISKRVQETEIKQNKIDQEYKKTQEQKPEKVPEYW